MDCSERQGDNYGWLLSSDCVTRLGTMSHSLPAAWPRTARRCTLPPAPGLVWSEVESKKSIFLRPAFRSLSPPPGPGTGVGEVVFPGCGGHMCGVMCSLYICMELCIKTWECPHTYLLELETNLREGSIFTEKATTMAFSWCLLALLHY